MRTAVKLAISCIAVAQVAAVPAQARVAFSGMYASEAGVLEDLDAGAADIPADFSDSFLFSSWASSPRIDVPADAANSDVQEEKGGSATLSLSELDSSRGGQALVLGNQSLKAITSGNVLTGDYVAGAVTFSDGAFSNFTGVGNIAINTGAQVSLQSGVNVIINVGQ